jgi:hypothetical protein
VGPQPTFTCELRQLLVTWPFGRDGSAPSREPKAPDLGRQPGGAGEVLEHRGLLDFLVQPELQ